MPDDPTRPPAFPLDPDLTAAGSIAAPRSSPRQWDVVLVIAAGGALGGAARWAVNQLWPADPGGFPWATFVENVSGCLVLGGLMVFLLEVWRPTRYARPFLAIGLLGGFTTFSAYTSETRALLLTDQAPLAMLYLFGTLLVGLLATWAGLALARSAAGLTSRGPRRRTR
ncbi:MAG TPA: CrcB family protein [Candidatus Limnocylindria bacterium]|nr:CrcB family protein [Candidatus Limnocylindria bacterium]